MTLHKGAVVQMLNPDGTLVTDAAHRKFKVEDYSYNPDGTMAVTLSIVE